MNEFMWPNGRQYVVLIAEEDLDSLEATAELAFGVEAQERIAKADDEIAKGQGLDVEQLSKLMQSRRIM